jgi:integrase
VNKFLAAKEEAIETKELTRESWNDYRDSASRVKRVLGENTPVQVLHQNDFARLRADIARTNGLVSLGNEVGRIRVIFNWGWKTKMLAQQPDYGLSFAKPTKKALRIHRANKPKKLYQVQEMRKLIYAAKPQLKAMALLAINCGLGNTDCARLTFEHVDLARGWLDYSRPKTGVERRAKLWPDTVTAIGEAIESNARLRARVTDDLRAFVFLTKYGQAWEGTETSSPISHECRKTLMAAGVYRPGLSFYAIRHTFQTIGDRSKDSRAVSFIMGHVDNSMAGVYREEFDNERLEAVSEYVRNWLFPVPSTRY